MDMQNVETQFKDAWKHKWVKVGLMAIAAIGLVLIIRARMGSAQSSATQSASGLSDAQAADQTQLAMQSNQLAAQQQEQQAAIGAAQTNSANQTAAALAALQEQDKTSLAAQAENDQTQLGLGNISLKAIESQYENLTAQQQNQLNAEISLSNISANENVQLNASNNQKDEYLSNNQVQEIASQTSAEIAASNNQEASANAASANALAAAEANDKAQVGIAQANNSGGGGCFITTAVCEARDLPDDCDTLQTLRAFRDTYLLSCQRGVRHVALYYATAPLILARINACDAPLRESLLQILGVQIDRAALAIKAGDITHAHAIYLDLVARAARYAYAVS